MKIRKLLLSAAAFLICTVPFKASAIPVNYEFTDLNEQLVYFEETNFASYQNAEFNFTNQTGSTWDAFQLRLEGDGAVGTSYDHMRFADIGSDGVIYSGPGTASFYDVNGSGSNEVMQVADLAVTDGSIFSFTVDIFGGVFPEGLYAFRVFAQPFSEGPTPAPVPAPSALFLVGAGLIGISGLRRRLRQI